ncbi:MAG: DNA photolyase family protein [Alphaproteobacteria bacterium]|nr:DNA photolyase family protein [Alphaproteobacteria bacterium]
MSNTNASQNKPLSLVWLRRDLRLHDHAALEFALNDNSQIQPFFIFDSDILNRFKNKKDRRLTFIAEALWKIHKALTKQNSGLLVFYGRASEIVPKLANVLEAKNVICAEDFEPETMKRDAMVKQSLEKNAVGFKQVVDHVIFSPRDVLKKDGSPYLVFTPYSKTWRSALHSQSFAEKKVNLTKSALPDIANVLKSLASSGLQRIDCGAGVTAMLDSIGYVHNPLELWAIEDARPRLEKFIGSQVNNYKNTRNFLAQNGTSMISPYLRHGILSIRELARLAVEQRNSYIWMNELIWREFYIMVLYHFPHSAHMELQEKYQHLQWSDNKENWQAFIESRTGYPVVDAAMRQLHEIGWMHNRARMIVASFLTKDLHIDWRWGEEHFAQWLMDYELASNVGGWQWAASTGTDAAPYFRVFNPVTQSVRFDEKGDYIHKWLPELKQMQGKDVHFPPLLLRPDSYAKPLVDHKEERLKAIEMFKSSLPD